MNEPSVAARSAWHELEPAAALERLESRRDGLTASEARARLEKYGPNAIETVPQASVLRILIDQLRSIVVGLLFVAAVLALLMRDHLEAAAILAVLVINTLIGFVVELRARRAMEALLGLEVGRATVLRDERPLEIDSRDVVPGDVVLLDAGGTVPADALILEESELRIDEAPLTGESVPVAKQAGETFDAPTPVADRTNMVWKSTTVVNGDARAVVVATGEHTEVGRIGLLTGSIVDERTPLEIRLNALGRRLVWLTLVVAALVVLVGLLRGFDAASMIEAGIALAIAAVPEGLPAVATITLGIGLRRMARRNALIRRLPAVEALGSATTICTDKTGTLTAGEMVATRIRLADTLTEIEGSGHDPEASFRIDGRTIRPDENDDLMLALRIGVLVNRARVEMDDGAWVVHGDPTEAALIVAGRRAGLEHDALAAEWPEQSYVPFSSERRYMATVHRTPDGATRVLVKGDPSRVIPHCETVLRNGSVEKLDADAKERLAAANHELASGGLRVLALAYADGDDHEGALTFVALAGLVDPPVAGVADTIARFQRAGIRTVMITGDQRPTAEAIARELGLLRAGDETLDGRDLHHMDDEALAARATRIGAFSRVSPEDKLRIITALQQRGEIVAMLGDGVNDAAALKKATIGVAMGRRGTDVAREAADVVLTDDRFETVGVAIEQGRVIWDNIRKFVFYLFSCNLAEVLVLMGALLAGLPLPLLPLQILWLNLITDTFPAFALALEPGDPDVMERPPRDPDAALLSRSFLGRIAFYAGLITASSLGAYVWGLNIRPDHAVTLCFMTLALAQILHLGNARSHDPVVSPRRALANPWALAAVGISGMLQLSTIFIPGLRLVLGTSMLTAGEWGIVIALSAMPAVFGQVLKLVRRS